MDAGLYVGHVMHHRLRPKRHRFLYKVFTLLLDLDGLGATDHRLRLLSVDRFNLFAFHNEDHGPRDGSPLRPWVEGELRSAGIRKRPGQIRLLAMPRFLGYVFNPLSIYYCYDDEWQLFAILYEVKNTFGEQHAYVFSLQHPSSTSGRFRHSCDKDFYVSPFIEAEAGYRFNVNDPGADLDVRIFEHVKEGPLLTATLKGKRRPLTDGQLLIQAFSQPFMPQKVISSIHYEALKLWLKGIGLQPRPITGQRREPCLEEGSGTKHPGSA